MLHEANIQYMRVLVTGAAGFIGSAVAAELVGQGHDVVAVDALIPQAHSGRGVDLRGLHRVDVRDRGALTGLLAGVDVVCHQAAMVGAGASVADMPLYAAHNDLGTATLLAAMAERGVDRLVLASSMVVYGEGRYVCARDGVQGPGPRAAADLRAGRFENRCPRCGRGMRWGLVDEDAPMDPRGSYAVAKLAQEHYARAWAQQCPGAVVALRYHNVYGPGMPRDTPYSGVAAMFRSALEHRTSPRVYEDGLQMRDFVHVSDVAAANVRALEAVCGMGDGRFESFNVCSGAPVSIGQVASSLCLGFGPGLVPVVTGEFRAGDVRHIVASPAKATRRLGFTAEVSPERGLVELARDPLRG